jgi:hypothetical protein
MGLLRRCRLVFLSFSFKFREMDALMLTSPPEMFAHTG